MVKYRRNGSLLYTSAEPIVYPLLVDTALFTTGAQIQGVVLAGNLVSTPDRPEPVNWTNVVGVTALRATSPRRRRTGWGNAGASSTRGIASGDGYAEFTVPASARLRHVRPQQRRHDQDYGDIDFAFYTYPATGQLLIYEKGDVPRAFGSYSPGDKLRIAVEGGAVTYRRNGVLLYTSGQPPNLPAAASTPPSTPTEPRSRAPSSPGPRERRPPTLTRSRELDERRRGDGFPRQLSPRPRRRLGQRRGLLDPGHLFRRRLRRVHQSRPAPATPCSGSATATTTRATSDIDFAFYTNPATGSSSSTRRASYRGPFGSYSPGDTLRIAVEGGDVKYRRNGVLLYTSGQAPTYPLRVDTALYSNGAQVQGVVLAGTLVDVVPPPTEAGELDERDGGDRFARAASTKTATDGWGNAGASSTRGISPAAATPSSPYSARPGYAMFGLSNGDNNQELRATSTSPSTPTRRQDSWLIYEKGVYRGAFGPYAQETSCGCRSEAGQVKYRRATASCSTRAGQANDLPAAVDTAFYSNGAQVQGAVLAGTLQDVP